MTLDRSSGGQRDDDLRTSSARRANSIRRLQHRDRSRPYNQRTSGNILAAPHARTIDRVQGGAPLPAHLRGAIIALGNFDGYHLGHQAVAARAVELARQRGVAAIVATFDPHPVRHFAPSAGPFRLTSLDQRQQLLAAAGVDAMMVFEFDETLANVTPEDFVEVWLAGAGGVVTGEKFSFGHKRAGNVEVLGQLCAERRMASAAVAPVTTDQSMVSSTRIRAALRNGECGTAAELLTRPFTIEGMVTRGARNDPRLPLIDASVALGEYLRPRCGVYAVRARLDDGRVIGGSAYLGPSESTFLELFLVDLTQQDFERRISVELVAHLHDANETYNAPTLRKQIVLDRSAACNLVFNDARLT